MSNLNAVRKGAKLISEFRKELGKQEQRRTGTPPPIDTMFLVSYDLHEGDDYSQLIDTLAEHGAKHVQDSVWTLSSALTLNELYDELKPFAVADRCLLIAVVGAMRSHP